MSISAKDGAKPPIAFMVKDRVLSSGLCDCDSSARDELPPAAESQRRRFKSLVGVKGTLRISDIERQAERHLASEGRSRECYR